MIQIISPPVVVEICVNTFQKVFLAPLALPLIFHLHLTEKKSGEEENIP